MNKEKQPCFKASVCRGQTGDKLDFCPGKTGEQYRQVYGNPAALSEQLCTSALETLARNRRRNEYLDDCDDAYYYLELALAGQNEQNRQQNFDEFLSVSSDVLKPNHELNEGQYHEFVRLQMISLYAPAFEKRVKRQEMDKDTISQVHANLCRWIGEFEPRIIGQAGYLDEYGKKAHFNKKTRLNHYLEEAEVAALTTRLEDPAVFLWPALPREEANHIRAKQNHDLYAVDETSNSNRKISTQVKSSSNGNGYGEMVIIRHREILAAIRDTEEAKRQAALDLARQSDISTTIPLGRSGVPKISDLLVQENQTGYYSLNEIDRNRLELASSFVATRLAASGAKPKVLAARA